MKAITSFFAILLAVVLSFYFAGMGNNVSADMALACGDLLTPDQSTVMGPEDPLTVNLSSVATFVFEWDESQCSSTLPDVLRLSTDPTFEDEEQELYNADVTSLGGSKEIDFSLDVGISQDQYMYIGLERSGNIINSQKIHVDFQD